MWSSNLLCSWAFNWSKSLIAMNVNANYFGRTTYRTQSHLIANLEPNIKHWWLGQLYKQSFLHANWDWSNHILRDHGQIEQREIWLCKIKLLSRMLELNTASQNWYNGKLDNHAPEWKLIYTWWCMHLISNEIRCRWSILQREPKHR